MERARAILLGASFPLALVALWHVAVVSSGTMLVPTPEMVGVMMRDFAFGGVYDDAFSGTILTHLFASMQRVYGGFLLAVAIGIPLGLAIGAAGGSLVQAPEATAAPLAAAQESSESVRPFLRPGAEAASQSALLPRASSIRACCSCISWRAGTGVPLHGSLRALCSPRLPRWRRSARGRCSACASDRSARPWRAHRNSATAARTRWTRQRLLTHFPRDEVVDDLLVWGPPQGCKETIERYCENGVTTPAPALFTGPDQLMDVVRAIAPWHGRVLVLNREIARGATPHGAVLPHLIHGGPGRAGGGDGAGSGSDQQEQRGTAEQRDRIVRADPKQERSDHAAHQQRADDSEHDPDSSQREPPGQDQPANGVATRADRTRPIPGCLNLAQAGSPVS